MKNLIYFFIKYGTALLFIILEGVAFYLIVNYNHTQQDIFINSTNIFATALNRRVDRVQEYLRLEEVNDSLQRQNGLLLKKFINSEELNLVNPTDYPNEDSIQYHLIPTKICNQTFHLKNNYLTLCDGQNKSIKKDMGVISVNGLVGTVIGVNQNYARVMSILHSQSRTSVALKKANTFGNLRWTGSSPMEMSLEAIPLYIHVEVGDTVNTSGYSTIFPRGLPVGVVEKVEKGTSEHQILVRLFNDPTQWDVVYVIDNILAQEQRELEEIIEQ